MYVPSAEQFDAVIDGSGLHEIAGFRENSSACPPRRAQKNSRHRDDAGCGLWGSDPGVQGVGGPEYAGKNNRGSNQSSSFLSEASFGPRLVRESIEQRPCLKSSSGVERRQRQENAVIGAKTKLDLSERTT